MIWHGTRAYGGDPPRQSPFSSRSPLRRIDGKGIARYGVDGMAVFQTDFTCGRHTFDPSSETGWCDYLAYDPDSPDADHGWVLIDSGTG